MNTAHSAKEASVFESFNARLLAPEQVAKSFIAPSSFADIAERSHTTIIGPRGSGKTSLLKMLQPSALQAWNSSEATGYRHRIDYTGVFIATDISWSKQTLALVEGLPVNLSKLFRGAAFTTHVLHEIVDVFNWRIEETETPRFRAAKLTLEAENALVSILSEKWELEPNTRSLIGLKHALAARLIDIWSLAQRTSLLGLSAETLPKWLTLDFLSCSSHAVEIFDDLIGQKSARWALLFDELELAPDWILRGLLNALRSTHQKFIYKLALSPFSENHEVLTGADQAMPDQDFREVRLWYPQKEDGFAFSERLFLSVCQAEGIDVHSVASVVGKSVLEPVTGTNMPYSKRSRQFEVINQALKTDPSFAAYWKKANVDINAINKMSESDRAAKVRKIYPLLMVRAFFRPPPGSKQASKQSLRGRKTLELYSGGNSLLTLAEANPRWIIGLTRLLIASATKLPIPPDEQAQRIESTLHKFRARLKTVNASQSVLGNKPETLLQVLDKIGGFFQKAVILDDFQTEPPLTFTVDSHTPPDVLITIGRAVNAGAIVFVPDSTSGGLLNDLKGKRFRLSYLLAPYYHLPLRLGATVSLNTILFGKKRGWENNELILL